MDEKRFDLSRRAFEMQAEVETGRKTAGKTNPAHKKTPDLRGFCEADEGARTLDLLHGKQTLYQLSYIRESARL